MQERLILSLFDLTGNWPEPYKEAGYTVQSLDEQTGWDVYYLTEALVKQLNPYGLLIALPCTHFAVSGSKHFAMKDADGTTAEAVRLAKHVYNIIHWCSNLKWWALENPVGRLNTLVPEYTKYGPWYFEPWWYGDPYRKKTGLWDTFNRDLPRNEVSPDILFARPGMSTTMKYGGKSLKTKNARSATPKGFARAFFLANP